ncbi:hypothetical protein TARUN_4747 [Trichoderma arundinaceum]|uniref:Dna repair rad5 n=1 Tax=Trichoderma arundinaceum TaxID=490622 RepID=A0A395NNQ4_TRIAR|nr:hypothetical protein TARUN_4747 [Trichoderma arundinaceum]
MLPSPPLSSPREINHDVVDDKVSDTAQAPKAIKAETDQRSGNQPYSGPKISIFSRFIGKSMLQRVGGHLQEMGSSQSSESKQGNKEIMATENSRDFDQQNTHPQIAGFTLPSPKETHSNEAAGVGDSNQARTIVKAEWTLRKDTQSNQGQNAQESDKRSGGQDMGEAMQQNPPDGSALRSPMDDNAGPQKTESDIGSTLQLASQEGQKNAPTEKKSLEDPSKKVVESTNIVKEESSPQATALNDTTNVAEKSSRKHRASGSSEKKRKRKHSKKRSKSPGRSRPSKRSKSSKSTVSVDEQGDGEIPVDEESSNKFSIPQTKARIPKGCSVRHDATQKEELRDGSKIFEAKRFKKMMSSSLHDHQIPVTAWMVKRERDTQRLACGGIVADEMGLGKTVVSLACIAANTPTKKERGEYSQATLVVVPNTKVANQWISEAKKHWHEDASAFVTMYGSDGRGIKQFEKQWIVLATYGQLRAHYPSQQTIERMQDLYRGDPVALAREFAKEAKDLFHIKWHRVILDEAHAITKWNGRKYREERIIRTAKEKLKIPPTTTEELLIEASEEEQIICNAVVKYYDQLAGQVKEEREKAKMPRFEDDEDEIEEFRGNQPRAAKDELKSGEGKLNHKTKKPLKKAAQTTKQMRLRQSLSHLYCLENLLMDGLAENDIQSLLTKLNSIEKKRTIMEQLEEDETSKKNLEQYELGLEVLADFRQQPFGGYFGVDKIMDMLMVCHKLKRTRCGENNCSSQNPRRFECGHIYCDVCLAQLTTERSNLSEVERSGGVKCTIDGCGAELLGGQKVRTLDMIASEAERDKNYVEIGKDALGNTVRSKFDRATFFVASSYGPRLIPPPSARVTATMAVALTWLSKSPEDKIIIFTQFIPTLKILGYLFESLHVKFIYYAGCMPKQKQEQAMKTFEEDPTVMVMISTLKSGGQSHNLTVANRVIIVDPWWNKAPELQAISRVARIGQRKRTYAVRIVTKHDMDGHIINLQRKKTRAVARMLQDDGHAPVQIADERLESFFAPKECKDSKRRRRKSKKCQSYAAMP